MIWYLFALNLHLYSTAHLPKLFLAPDWVLVLITYSEQECCSVCSQEVGKVAHKRTIPLGVKTSSRVTQSPPPNLSTLPVLCEVWLLTSHRKGWWVAACKNINTLWTLTFCHFTTTNKCTLLKFYVTDQHKAAHTCGDQRQLYMCAEVFSPESILCGPAFWCNYSCKSFGGLSPTFGYRTFCQFKLSQIRWGAYVNSSFQILPRLGLGLDFDRVILTRECVCFRRSIVALDLRLGSWSCWKLNLCRESSENRFSSAMALHVAPSIFWSPPDCDAVTTVFDSGGRRVSPHRVFPLIWPELLLPHVCCAPTWLLTSCKRDFWWFAFNHGFLLTTVL